jgi:hypothetical protein
VPVLAGKQKYRQQSQHDGEEKCRENFEFQIAFFHHIFSGKKG